jgi:hypothetical protein
MSTRFLPAIFLTLAVCILPTDLAVAQATTKAPEPRAKQATEFSPGIAVGKKVPAIQLKDQTDSVVDLGAVLKKRQLVTILQTAASSAASRRAKI